MVQSTDPLTKNWWKGQTRLRPKVAPDTSVWDDWPSDPGETSAGGTRETGPSSLKGFCRSEKWGMPCVCVCVLGLHVPCELHPERKICLAGNADGQAMLSQQSPCTFSPQVAAAPRGAFHPQGKLLSPWCPWPWEAWYSKGTTGRRFHLCHPGARPSWKICALFFS